MFFNKTPETNPVLANLGEAFNEHELATLDSLGTIIDLPAGAVLAREGAVGQEAVIVIAGNANVVRDGEVIATAGPTTILGEGALITGEARNASLIAETGLTVCVLNRREFHSWLDQCPRVAVEVDALAVTRA